MDRSTIERLARSHGVSPGAVEQVAAALARGGGTLAQFDHPDLGGRGQWMPGMVQVGRMFDDALKARVAALFAEVAALGGAARKEQSMEPMKPMRPMEPMKPMEPMRPMEPAAAWWPGDLGSPDASGGQNDVRYAFFGDRHRLIVEKAGRRLTFDTGGRRINGIAQSQGDTSELRFSSDAGDVPLTSLTRVDESNG